MEIGSDEIEQAEGLLRIAPDAMLLVDAAGRILAANARAEGLFASAAGGLTSRSFAELVPEGRPVESAVHARRCDGTGFVAEMAASAAEELPGRPTIVTVRDVTGRGAGHGAGAVLATLLESSEDAIVGKTLDGTVTSWNPGAERLYGYPAAEAIGRSMHDLVGDADRAEIEEAVRGATRRREARRARRDGTPVDVSLTISPIRDAGGRAIGVATVARDITDRRRAERTVEQLLELAPDAIVGIDAAGAIVRANRQFEQVFAHERATVLGRPVDVLIPERYRAAHRVHLREYFADPRTRPMGAGLTLFAVRADGTEFPAEISLSSIDTEDGVLATAAVRDISDRVRRDDRERALREELAQSRRMESVGQLAGGIAHDFNNLLAVILNYAQFVADELPEGARAREDLVEVLQAGERARALIRQLLIFSRRQVTQPEVLDLNHVISGLTNLLRRALGERIDLTCELEPDLWTIEADAGQLEQVLVNLAVNARDAMPEGGRLVVRTENAVIDETAADAHLDLLPGRYVRTTVSDTGTGMPPDVAERAFEPFFTTKGPEEGSGLGLSTVYGIVTQAGGRVDLYSEPGVGTSVKVHLPAVSGRPSGAVAALAAAAAGRGEVVLVVEDDAAVRRVAERVLGDHGYRVVAVDAAGAALEAAAGGRIDLLLTDVVMPGLHGRDVARALRERRPGLRVVYMSGYSQALLTRDVLAGDPTAAFIEKPFNAGDLLRIVREALDRA